MSKTDSTKITGVEPSYLWNTSKNTDSAYLSHILKEYCIIVLLVLSNKIIALILLLQNKTMTFDFDWYKRSITSILWTIIIIIIS